MKKFVLFAAAGMLTTATIVYATVSSEKKPVKKEMKVKKESKCNKASRMHCVL